MSSALPRELFKYQPTNRYSIENLRKKQIYFNYPYRLNDPHEILETPPIKLIDELEAQQLVNRVMMDAGHYPFISPATGKPHNERFRQICEHRIRERMESFRMTGGVTCFTESPHYEHMWKIYAQNHTGFCLRFRTNKPPFRTRDVRVYRVHYGGWPEQIDPARLLELIRYDGFIEALFCHKRTEWAHENEWRMLHVKGNQPYQYDFRALTGVYFGAKTSAADQAKIKSALGGRALRLTFYAASSVSALGEVLFSEV